MTDTAARAGLDHHADDRLPPLTDDEAEALAGTPGDPAAKILSLAGHDQHQADDDDAERSSRIRPRLIRGAAIFDIPQPVPLIDSYLYRDSLAVTFAQPKQYKTFVATDQGLSIATGNDWHGHAVHAGPVLYVAAEGASGIGMRVNAWLAHHGHDRDDLDRFLLYPERVDLLDTASMIDLAATAAELEAVLVVVDTLARCMPGGDENSSKDMSRAIDALDAVRLASGACVNAVHHAGKDTSKGMRGHSALWGAVNTSLEVARLGAGKITVAVVDQKDAPEADLLHLKMQPVAGSLVPVFARPDARRGLRSEKLTLVMEALSDAIVASPGLSKSAARFAVKGATDTKKAAMEALERDGLLTVNQGRVGTPWTCEMTRPYRAINDPLAPSYDPEAEVPPPCR